ncbi:MAG: phosphatidylserine decarboxylase family protein [Acidobacteria bacterium]|nr:MAG: phosphatidylserine decarboxylase family protein [Acidobacteriota bacterium]
MSMVKEGYWYGLPLVLLAGGLMGFRLYGSGAFFLILAVLILNFFRDPEREIPADPRAIVSPADGRVVEIRDVELDSRPARRVSIFMSPFDVHVNRSPIGGTVKQVSYRKGNFRMAMQARASVENEQNVFTIRGEDVEVVVKQIAGVLARRIVFWKQPGERLERGERVGMIKFGSRVDVVVEAVVELKVEVGDRVRAGSSVLGITNSNSQAGH